MAVYVYGVVNTDVYKHLPFDTSSISATSKVKPTDITSFIEEASSQFTGAFKNAGVAYESLSDDQNQQVAQAIEAYAAAKTLLSLGMSAKTQTALMDIYKEILDDVRKTEQVLGTSGSTVRSNINTTNQYPRRFSQTSGW